ncbi:protein archease [Methanobrevibacter cuticularis]|uniref:Protein archease n=1 Tax=Methanobrevibacter cuticularis TaxID=47311 RepID=A0A166CZS7_9EURY|nr:archease [Methanobrevibacter cuticularis]KZX15046.1 protein archease [Methanobrevibacter cuticularis]
MKGEISENQKNINKKYEFFDVTADIGYWAYGKTLEEAYENAALAMFNVMTNTKQVSENISREIYIESEDLVSLLYDFLEELLFLHEIELLFFSKFEITIKKDELQEQNIYLLKAKAIGDNIDWNIHEKGSEVKAITFHMMKVVTSDISKVRVILDL